MHADSYTSPSAGTASQLPTRRSSDPWTGWPSSPLGDAPSAASGRRPGRRGGPPRRPGLRPEDRKSTRLNSSHVAISYADVCVKKKKTGEETDETITRPSLRYNQHSKL